MTKVSEHIKTLVEEVLICHETEDFDRLKALMDKSTIDDPNTFLTKEKFEEVCGKIHEQLGEFENIEYIGQLNKINSLHTLWKANYSKIEEEILWTARVSLDNNDPKIIRMSVSVN